MSKMKCFARLFLLCLLYGWSTSFNDPYKVLGITKSASVPDIRKAYKELAKIWHPDKNDDPAAEDKFVEINRAYELLTDPERRRMFDTFNRVVEEPRARPDRSTNSHSRHHFDPFDEFFTQSGFRFRFSDRDITLFHKLSITSRAYENTLLPKSYRTPYLILFYSDWCFPCLQIEPVWRRIMDELEHIGVGIATVHAENEKGLARKVGVASLPSLIFVTDGRARVYKESLFSVQKVVDFVRSKLPYKMIQPVTDDNASTFLKGWSDNKIRALVFQSKEPLRLRYLLTAYYHRDRVAFGHVATNGLTAKLRTKYQVSGEQDTLLVFNEMTDHPVASLSMLDIPVNTMHDVIKSNYFLLLPRLSSQAMLDELCPVGLASNRKRFCVVLVCQDTPSHEPQRDTLRKFVVESRYSKERVRFMYIFQERQPQFISALTSSENSPSEPVLHVAILSRRDTSRVKYEWLVNDETTWDNYNSTKTQLKSAIDRLLHASTIGLANEAVIGELIDEHTQGPVSQFFSRLLLTLEFFQDSLGKEHILPVVSIVVTVLVIAAAGYLMNYLMKLEEEKIKGSSSASFKSGSNGSATPSFCSSSNGSTTKLNGSYQPTLKIHEMRAETYNGLVRLLKPGCRTILLLVDNETKTKLLPKFHKSVWPYRKNKALMFAMLNLDRGLSWYGEVLGQSLSEPRSLKINPRNCIGTVLALNGLRKYFCMYHAKHPEDSTRSGSRMRKIMNRQIDPAGAFIGFDESSSESELSDVEIGFNNKDSGNFNDVIFVENLLDGLPNWLDRLFEGTTHRYYLNYWPDFGIK